MKPCNQLLTRLIIFYSFVLVGCSFGKFNSATIVQTGTITSSSQASTSTGNETNSPSTGSSENNNNNNPSPGNNDTGVVTTNPASSDMSSVNLTSDPLLKYSWHLKNTGQKVFAETAAKLGVDLNLINTWSLNILGQTVLVQVSDDGLEDTHEDLKSNFSYNTVSKNYTLKSPYTATTSAPITSDDNHGTSVAGLIAAEEGNNVGSRGVSPKAKLMVANTLSSAVSVTSAIKLDQATGPFDISNMSWGTTQDTIYTQEASYIAQIKTAATSGRSGKGVVFVKASGNDFAVYCHGSTTSVCIGNSNFDSDNSIPYIISVGALNALGQPSSYSSAGSNIWISSFGGEFGTDTPAMLTTDRTGCSKGYAVSSETTNSFENGKSNENSNCNYTSLFNGTSSAAPVLSGVIALMLEANPFLTFREIKYILAKTAKVDNYSTGEIAHPTSVTLPAGYVWEQKWITNSAGFKFHNWFGFGRVDVDAAINLAILAKNQSLALGTFVDTNWNTLYSKSNLNLAIPDNSSAGVTSTISVANNLTIEAVQIRINITHADISELALELTSPSGTKSILINARNSLTGISNFVGETFLTNAFYQENSVGNWTLKVIDAKSGKIGTLTSFKLNFLGGSH